MKSESWYAKWNIHHMGEGEKKIRLFFPFLSWMPWHFCAYIYIYMYRQRLIYRSVECGMNYLYSGWCKPASYTGFWMAQDQSACFVRSSMDSVLISEMQGLLWTDSHKSPLDCQKLLASAFKKGMGACVDALILGCFQYCKFCIR